LEFSERYLSCNFSKAVSGFLMTDIVCYNENIPTEEGSVNKDQHRKRLYTVLHILLHQSLFTSLGNQ
jgi:pullulanase/glycogen debranching enzyme